ncbi:MAG: bifunctional DNA primase/polymerase, partial [Rhodospirillaceae bacterium]|nr:bifunctional DNA primase/polymerase [Rhodospirillaceae bacterium]
MGDGIPKPASAFPKNFTADPPGTTLAAALAYAGRGWAVLPLLHNSKRPASRHGVKDATTDGARVLSWDARVGWASCNVAIRTGAESGGLFVADVDVKNGGPGLASLEKLQLPVTRTIVTPSGGMHLYFFYDPTVHSFSSGTNVLGPAVDTRANDAYVAAPPSIIDGRAYRVLHECEPAPLPPSIIERLHLRRVREAES